MFTTEQLQKVDPAFALGARKTGKPFIANMRAIAVLALVTGTGIIHIEMR